MFVRELSSLSCCQSHHNTRWRIGSILWLHIKCVSWPWQYLFNSSIRVFFKTGWYSSLTQSDFRFAIWYFFFFPTWKVRKKCDWMAWKVRPITLVCRSELVLDKIFLLFSPMAEYHACFKHCKHLLPHYWLKYLKSPHGKTPPQTPLHYLSVRLFVCFCLSVWRASCQYEVVAVSWLVSCLYFCMCMSLLFVAIFSYLIHTASKPNDGHFFKICQAKSSKPKN